MCIHDHDILQKKKVMSFVAYAGLGLFWLKKHVACHITLHVLHLKMIVHC